MVCGKTLPYFLFATVAMFWNDYLFSLTYYVPLYYIDIIHS